MLTVLRRALAALLLVALSIMSLTVLGVTAASASTTGPGESQFVAKINAARAAAGRPGLSSAGDLVTIARRHSAQMAADAKIYHNPHLTTEVTGWKIVGENVGQGPTVDALQTAFMNSPAHRDNILDPQYTQVGIGTVVDDRGQMFVTEVFRLPQAAASRPAPKPAAVPVAAKPAAPKPAAVAPVAPKPAAAAPAAGKTASSKPAPARPAPQPAATKPAVPAAPGTGDTAAAVATAPAAASQPTLADRLALARHARATASPASTATDPLSRVSAYTAVMRALAG